MKIIRNCGDELFLHNALRVLPLFLTDPGSVRCWLNSMLYHTPVLKSNTSAFLGSNLFNRNSCVCITEYEINEELGTADFAKILNALLYGKACMVRPNGSIRSIDGRFWFYFWNRISRILLCIDDPFSIGEGNFLAEFFISIGIEVCWKISNAWGRMMFISSHLLLLASYRSMNAFTTLFEDPPNTYSTLRSSKAHTFGWS